MGWRTAQGRAPCSPLPQPAPPRPAWQCGRHIRAGRAHLWPASHKTGSEGASEVMRRALPISLATATATLAMPSARLAAGAGAGPVHRPQAAAASLRGTAGGAPAPKVLWLLPLPLPLPQPLPRISRVPAAGRQPGAGAALPSTPAGGAGGQRSWAGGCGGLLQARLQSDRAVPGRVRCQSAARLPACAERG